MELNKTYIGTTIWFSAKKSYGFIEWEIDGVKQQDIFVHFSDINMQGFKTLAAGQKVSFEIGFNKNGAPKAINVTLIQ